MPKVIDLYLRVLRGGFFVLKILTSTNLIIWLVFSNYFRLILQKQGLPAGR